MRDRAAATDVEPQNDSAVYDSSRGCPPAGSWPTSGWQDDVETRDMGDGAAATDVEPQNDDVLYDWSFGCPPACPSPTPSRQDDVEKPDMGDGAVATDVEPPTPSAVLAEVLARSMGGSAPSMTSLLRGLSRTGVTTDVAQALLGQRPPAEAPAEAVRAASEFAELVQTLAMTEPRARKVYKDAERARKAERKDAERAYLDAQYAADIVLLRSACVDIALRGRASARRERGPTSWDVPRFVVLDTATAEEAALIETHDAAMDRFEADYQRACAAADHRRDAALLDAIDLRDYRNIRDAEQAAADAKNTFHSKVHTGRRFLDAKELGAAEARVRDAYERAYHVLMRAFYRIIERAAARVPVLPSLRLRASRPGLRAVRRRRSPARRARSARARAPDDPAPEPAPARVYAHACDRALATGRAR